MNEIAMLLVAVCAGMLRISTGLLWIAVGDCLTQRSGYFNLGIEGNVAFSAVVAVAVTGTTGNPWFGVLAAGFAGGLFALFFVLCMLVPRVSELGVGIAMLITGISLARFVGSDLTTVRTELLPSYVTEDGIFEINLMLLLGILFTVILSLLLSVTKTGLLIKAVGDRRVDVAVQLLGIRPWLVRMISTIVGGCTAGIGASCFGLFYPSGWSDELTTGSGIMALTLCFLARNKPLRTMLIVFVFSAVIALGPILQVSFGAQIYHLFNALPYLFALLLLVYVSNSRMLK